MSEIMAEGRVDSSPVKPKKKYPYKNYYTYMECKYSPSCFECPLEDCKVGLTVAMYRNALPEEISKHYHTRQLRKMRLYG